MYRKWAEKQGYIGRLVEKCSGKNSIIKSATIEFEFEYAFGYLSGERGVHFLISSQSGSDENQVTILSDFKAIFLEREMSTFKFLSSGKLIHHTTEYFFNKVFNTPTYVCVCVCYKLKKKYQEYAEQYVGWGVFL